MSTSKGLWALLLATGLVAEGCESADPAGGIDAGNFKVMEGAASVHGSIATSAGYQHVSAALGSAGYGEPLADPAFVRAVLRDGPDSIVVTGDIEEDGSFILRGLPQWGIPFMIEVLDRKLSLVGVVVVPGPLGRADDQAAMPVSRETTQEARTWGLLTARSGNADPIAVASAISAQMAIVSSGDTWTDPVDAALRTWRASMDLQGAVATDPSSTLAARAPAFADLAAALFAADTPDGEALAWNQWRNAELTSLGLTTGIDAQGQALAATAAAFALVAETSRAGLPEAVGAHAFAAALTQAAQIQSRARIPSGNADTELRLTTAYDTFFESVAQATSVAEVDSAQRSLTQALGNALSSASSDGTGGPTLVSEAAIGAATKALDDSLAAAKSPEGIAAACVSFSNAARAATGTAIQPGSSAFATSLVVQRGLLGSVAGARTVPAAPDGMVTGILLEENTPASGVRVLVADLDPALDTAVGTMLGAVRSDGAFELIGVGTADPRTGTWSAVVAPQKTEPFVAVKLMGDSGAIVGAAFVPGGIEGGVFVAPPVSELTTARTLVTLEVLATGTATVTDLALFDTLIADGTARALLAQNDVPAAATAFALAQSTWEITVALGVDPDLASLAANAAFELGIRTQATGSTVPVVVDAEAQLRAGAMAAEATLPLVVADAVVTKALKELAAGTAAAETQHDVAAAGQRFEQAVRGAVVTERVVGTSIQLFPLVANALFDAADARDALIDAVRGATADGATRIDSAIAIGTAYANYEANVHAAFEAAVAAEPELGAIEEAVTILGAGLYATALDERVRE